MIKLAYTFSSTAAIFLALLVLSGCTGKQKQATIHIDTQHMQRTEAAVLMQQIQTHATHIEQLVSHARLEHPIAYSRNQLLLLTQDKSLPQQSQGFAALKYAELVLLLQTPDAMTVAGETLLQWKEHAYAPRVQLQLARVWVSLDVYDAALAALTQAFLSYDPTFLEGVASTMESELVEHIVAEAEPLLDVVEEVAAIQWLLAIAMYDEENREMWLQQAAKRASLKFVLQLRQLDMVFTNEIANFYRYAARDRLMVGDYHAVRVISKILQRDMPDTPANTVVLGWAENEGQQNVVGVLLPLSGKYAAYGQQMLKGIRLAISRPEFKSNITLRIQDSAGDEQVCISAYYQLLTDGAQWVIGPLLSKNTAALAPYLVADVPVISLANQTQLAAGSPALFIHSLAKTIQADFMANYALQQGKRRIAIIHGSKASEVSEGLAFAQTFMDAGGDIMDIMMLKEGESDHRPALLGLRERTDDEVLLASLDEALHLFSPEPNMEIKLPLDLDAIYLAMSGKKISALAGQMAYLDIQQTQFYGSYRWFDGHLMDDDGRYLSYSEFATPMTSLHQPSQAVLDIKSQYRVIWNDDTVSPLFFLAYDVAMNIASLGSRLGLKGKDAMLALHHTAGFPAISGDYYFDDNGMSQKMFAIQKVMRGRIEVVPTSTRKIRN